MIHPTASCKIFTLSDDRNELVYSARAKYLQIPKRTELGGNLESLNWLILLMGEDLFGLIPLL